MIDTDDRELLELAAALRDDGDSLCGDAQLPPAGLVWWRSTIRARAEAARTAERPITAVQSLAAACVIALAIAAIGAIWDSLPDVVVQHAMLVAAGVAVCLIVAPIAVFAALAD